MHKNTLTLLLAVSVATTLNAKPKITYEADVGSVSVKDYTFFKYKKTAESKFSDIDVNNLSKSIINYSGSPIVPETVIQSGNDEDEGQTLHLKSDSDPSCYLDIRPNFGEIRFNGGFQRYQVNMNTPNLPGKGQAKKLIFEHLQNIGIAIDNNEVYDVKVGGMAMGVHHESGETENFEKFVKVRITRKLDELPVFGASRIVARLAENGTLHSLVFRWIDVEKQNLSADDLIDDATLNAAVDEKLQKKGEKAETIKIKVKELGLFDDGNGTIEPVIFVAGTGNFGNAETKEGKMPIEGSVDFFVPLLKNSELKIPDADDNAVPVPESK